MVAFFYYSRVFTGWAVPFLFLMMVIYHRCFGDETHAVFFTKVSSLESLSYLYDHNTHFASFKKCGHVCVIYIFLNIFIILLFLDLGSSEHVFEVKCLFIAGKWRNTLKEQPHPVCHTTTHCYFVLLLIFYIFNVVLSPFNMR